MAEQDNTRNFINHSTFSPTQIFIQVTENAWLLPVTVALFVALAWTRRQVPSNSASESTGDVDPLESARECFREDYIRQAWIQPLSFVREIIFDPEDHYVKLTLEFLNRDGTLKEKCGTIMDLKALLDPLPPPRYSNRATKVLIRGHAGFGKTTLCNKIAWDWARGKFTFEIFRNPNSILILFHLRLLSSGMSIEDQILKKVVDRTIGRNWKNTKTDLQKIGTSVILLFDGFDEVNPEHRQEIMDTFLTPKEGQQGIFRRATIIITSRLEKFDKDFWLKFRMYFDRQFRIGGLTKDQCKELITIINERLSKKISGEGSRLNLLDKFSLAIHLHHLYEIGEVSPMIVFLLCYVWKDVKEYSIQQSDHLSGLNSDDIWNINSADSFYKKTILIMARRYRERDGETIVDDDSVKRKLNKLGALFLRLLLEGETILVSSRGLRKHLDDNAWRIKGIDWLITTMKNFFGTCDTDCAFCKTVVQEDDYAFLTGCGILKAPFDHHGELTFEPTHKKLMEVLAMVAASVQWEGLNTRQEKARMMLEWNMQPREAFVFLHKNRMFTISVDMIIGEEFLSHYRVTSNENGEFTGNETGTFSTQHTDYFRGFNSSVSINIKTSTRKNGSVLWNALKNSFGVCLSPLEDLLGEKLADLRQIDIHSEGEYREEPSYFVSQFASSLSTLLRHCEHNSFRGEIEIRYCGNYPSTIPLGVFTDTISNCYYTDVGVQLEFSKSCDSNPGGDIQSESVNQHCRNHILYWNSRKNNKRIRFGKDGIDAEERFVCFDDFKRGLEEFHLETSSSPDPELMEFSRVLTDILNSSVSFLLQSSLKVVVETQDYYSAIREAQVNRPAEEMPLNPRVYSWNSPGASIIDIVDALTKLPDSSSS